MLVLMVQGCRQEQSASTVNEVSPECTAPLDDQSTSRASEDVSWQANSDGLAHAEPVTNAPSEEPGTSAQVDLAVDDTATAPQGNESLDQDSSGSVSENSESETFALQEGGAANSPCDSGTSVAVNEAEQLPLFPPENPNLSPTFLQRERDQYFEQLTMLKDGDLYARYRSLTNQMPDENDPRYKDSSGGIDYTAMGRDYERWQDARDTLARAYNYKQYMRDNSSSPSGPSSGQQNLQ